ncbi:MAG: hypothetical protein Q9191_007827, partial [Dirinaria sp. TL-2023a]
MEPRIILANDFPHFRDYLEITMNQPVLWKLQEPLDTREIVAHAAKIPVNDLEVITLGFRACKLRSNDVETVCDERIKVIPSEVYERKITYFECAVVPRSAVGAVQDWYLRQGLWPFTGKRVMWGDIDSLLLMGYPQHAKDNPAAQVNIDRALTA